MRLTKLSASATEIEKGDLTLLFSYNTLVAVQTPKGIFFQRDGKAGSRTTAKHITQWRDGRDASQVSEQELKALAGEV